MCSWNSMILSYGILSNVILSNVILLAPTSQGLDCDIVEIKVEQMLFWKVWTS